MYFPEISFECLHWFELIQRKYIEPEGNMNIYIFTDGHTIPVHCRLQFSICLYFPSNFLIGSEWHSKRMYHRGSVTKEKWFGWKVASTSTICKFHACKYFISKPNIHTISISFWPYSWFKKVCILFFYFFFCEMICVTDHNASCNIHIFISRIRFHNKQCGDGIFYQIK